MKVTSELCHHKNTRTERRHCDISYPFAQPCDNIAMNNNNVCSCSQQREEEEEGDLSMTQGALPMRQAYCCRLYTHEATHVRNVPSANKANSESRSSPKKLVGDQAGGSIMWGYGGGGGIERDGCTVVDKERGSTCLYCSIQ